MHRAAWVPTVLGIVRTIVLFYGNMLLIAETRVALWAVNDEMAFVLRLPELYRTRTLGGGENERKGDRE